MVDTQAETGSAPTGTPTGTPTHTTQLASEVGEDVARSAWAIIARELLLEAAQRYRAVVTYREMSAAAQERTGIHTTQRTQVWLGDVLTLVARDCAERGEPSLASLCVDASGSVGDTYAAGLLATSGEAPADPERHAAATRLSCYQHFGAPDLPADGGLAALTPKLEASRARARKAAVAARPINMCPVCFMSIPVTGVCVNCE